MSAGLEEGPDAVHGQRYRWVVLSGIWLIYFSFGLQITGIAPLIGPVSGDLGLSYAQMGGVLSAWPLFYVFASIPCGALVDRLGTRWSLVIAVALMSASAIARALAVDFWTLFFAVAVFGVGGPLLSITAPKAAMRWFSEQERGLAMGIYFTGTSIGGITALALANSVLMPLAGGNWRIVLGLYAAITVAGGLYWFVLSARSVFVRVEAWGAGEGGITIREQIVGFGELLRVPAVLLILGMSMGTFFFYDGTSNWLPEILVAHGFTPADAGLWSAAPVAVGVVASLIVPRLATRRWRSWIMLGLFICVAVGALSLMSSNPWVLGVAFLAHGIARGGLMTVALMMLMDTRGVPSHRLGAAGGLFFTAAELGGVFGPVSFGVLFDATGGFAAPLAVLAAAGCVLILLLALHHRVEGRHARAAPAAQV